MDNNVEWITEWSNQTRLYSLGLTAVIVLGIVMLAVKRRYAIVSMILMACFIAPNLAVGDFLKRKYVLYE